MTSFHYTELTTGRTKFYRNRELAPGALSTLASALDGLIVKAGPLSTALDTATNKAGSAVSALSALQEEIGTANDPETSVSFFGKLKGLLQLIPQMAPPASVSESQTQKIWPCIRALNRVEDLVADTSFDVRKNNKELGRIEGDSLLDKAKGFLSEDLSKRLADAHRSFPSTEKDVSTARWERFLELQHLRQDMLAHLATSRESAFAASTTPQVDSEQNS